MPFEFIEAGDIGAAVGFKDIKTGDTLSERSHRSYWNLWISRSGNRYRR